MKDFFNKETLDKIKQFCAENKKYVGVAGVLVGLILILIVVVAGGNNGTQSNTEAGSQTEISVKDFEFEKDYTNDAKDEKISEVINDYKTLSAKYQDEIPNTDYGKTVQKSAWLASLAQMLCNLNDQLSAVFQRHLDCIVYLRQITL